MSAKKQRREGKNLSTFSVDKFVDKVLSWVFYREFSGISFKMYIF